LIISNLGKIHPDVVAPDRNRPTQSSNVLVRAAGICLSPPLVHYGISTNRESICGESPYRHRTQRGSQWPIKFGLRFSKNADRPSAQSSERKQ
jgi:hypothetical protein